MIVSLAATELPGWVNWVTGVATVIIALALIVATIALAGLALAARKMMVRVNGLVGRMQEGALPMLQHGRDAAENIDYITSSIREDVQQFKGTLRTAQTRLERAAQHTEERIGDFNALLEVVQEEAEAIFVSTASTVRGVQAGADRLRSFRGRTWDDEGDEPEEPVDSPLGDAAKP